MLLDNTQRELPMGQKGWRVVWQKYNKWATSNGRPARNLKSLETKYKQVTQLPWLADFLLTVYDLSL